MTSLTMIVFACADADIESKKIHIATKIIPKNASAKFFLKIDSIILLLEVLEVGRLRPPSPNFFENTIQLMDGCHVGTKQGHT